MCKHKFVQVIPPLVIQDEHGYMFIPGQHTCEDCNSVLDTEEVNA